MIKVLKDELLKEVEVAKDRLRIVEVNIKKLREEKGNLLLKKQKLEEAAIFLAKEEEPTESEEEKGDKDVNC